MRTRIAVGLVATFAAGMAFVPLSAKATCVQTIYAERASSTASGNVVSVTGRNDSTSDFVWTATTNFAPVASLIFSAVAQRNLVTITGSASSCPGDGTNRAMGSIQLIVQQP